jgi:hypothetical protein
MELIGLIADENATPWRSRAWRPADEKERLLARLD